MDIFERASRAKLRFRTTVGDLTTEQLWDLPLTAKGERTDLDKVARAVFTELKGIEEASFVDTTPNPRKVELELAHDIAKHVIASKQASAAAAVKAAETRAYKEQLLAAKDNKKAQALANMSEDEINAELAKLQPA